MPYSTEDYIKIGARTAIKFAESGVIKTPEERVALEIVMSDPDIKYYLETKQEHANAREPFIHERSVGLEVSPSVTNPNCIYPTYSPSVGCRHINEEKRSWILANAASYPLLIDCTKRDVWVAGHRVHVTRCRFALLAILLRLEGRAELDHIVELLPGELCNFSYEIQRESLYEAKSDLLTQLNRQGQVVSISVAGEIMTLDEPKEYLFIDKC